MVPWRHPVVDQSVVADTSVSRKSGAALLPELPPLPGVRRD